MLTGEIRSQVDRIWDAFWSGGISNPLEVIEQITYLLFLRRLDEMQTREENKANRLAKPIERAVYPAGNDPQGRPYDDLRWSRFKNLAPAEMFALVDQRVFPFLREIGGDGSTYAHHMKDARFTIPNAALLAKVVDLIDDVPMADRDTKGDLYEYMLSKIATAGANGQFRTPRHIIELMVELTAPGTSSMWSPWVVGIRPPTRRVRGSFCSPPPDQQSSPRSAPTRTRSRSCGGPASRRPRRALGGTSAHFAVRSVCGTG